MDVLEKQFGAERVLFLCCDVESEEQTKGSPRSHTLRHQNVPLLSLLTEPGSGFVCFSQDAFQRVAETFGGLDIFCNNAGILNEIEWQKTISINLVRKCGLPPPPLPSDSRPDVVGVGVVLGLCHQGQLPGSGAHEQAERRPWRRHRQHLVRCWWLQTASLEHLF